MANTYSVNDTDSYPEYPRGYTNASQITDQLLLVDTYDEFQHAIQNDWKAQAAKYSGYYDGSDSYVPYTSIRGGIWMGDETSKPTVLVNVLRLDSVTQMPNFITIMTTGVPISVAYYRFATTIIPGLINFKVLMFIVYYGLIMCCAVATGLLSASTRMWRGLGIIFLIFFLYGIVCALLSYVISMFAKGAVSAWFLMALGQVVMFFAYFGGIIVVQSGTAYPNMERQMNALYFGLGIISPAVSLERTLFIGLQQMVLSCNGRSIGSIYLYGGPILYLVLQAIFLFALLLWWDSGFVMPTVRSPKVTKDAEATDMYSTDLVTERKRLDSSTTDLHVESVSKSFGKNLAVDNVTFGFQQSEIFALLGPNGAGKSTITSMIRGDVKPSTSNSAINIAGHSIRTNAVAARASLGVCPQFDSADVLTVQETLRFFAKIRGVLDIEHNVATVILACGLSEWTKQLAQKLSGGTKRKLSLAVALVGNPRVLVLDEPSSALDANAKRTLWRCLQTMAKGRAVVLTTHSMEEAYALADRIGIVSSRMLALGDREDLKKRAGENFYVHLVSASSPCTTPQELDAMKTWIASSFVDAKISRGTQGGQIRFEVPAEGCDLVGLIRVLEGVKAELGVEFYSVGKATLDEVFENIVKRYGDGEGVEA
ncbi:P-loop containing nucleoside triphosphate hydrolase protein [Clathrospora elynae]|uniref:P-loop containing nucleoside triphosphate hydrolase protein n=1 Tax=Clathrospora elynae TaxID=706981 RepID=A0A6A5SEZ7_9PLEO|nr:P-loop containing nucleoside triphosphate hydrolase protein [Clathrospora elynae]